MAKSILQMISTSYRALSQEQDDTILWLTQALKKAGSHLTVVFEGTAVNYAHREQGYPKLTIGEWQQTRSPDLVRDIEQLMQAGVSVYAIDEDLSYCGLHHEDLIDGVQPTTRQHVADLAQTHDFIWRW